MSQINLPYATVSYEAPIVFYKYKEGTELGFPEMKELIACAEALSNHQPYLTLSDVRVSINLTQEGKRYLTDLNNMPYFRGTAAIVRNSLFSFAANILSQFDNTKYPFRAFTDYDKALEWLKTLPLTAAEK